MQQSNTRPKHARTKDNTHPRGPTRPLPASGAVRHRSNDNSTLDGNGNKRKEVQRTAGHLTDHGQLRETASHGEKLNAMIGGR
eukprot:3751747-Alexandrium_andersonii.AAC.1